MNNLEAITNTYTDSIDGRGFHVYKGWNSSIAEEIVKASTQPHIIASTPNDYTKRFRDVYSANAWNSERKRSVYTLRSIGLAGLIWYDVRPRPDIGADYTFAIRMYEEAVGKKLSLVFMNAAHTDFSAEKGNPAVWLETDETNHIAVHLYNKFGYQLVDNSNGRLTMVYRKK